MNARVNQRIIRAQYELPKDVPISREAQDLLSKIFVSDPKDRLTAPQIQQHPWLSGTAWLFDCILQAFSCHPQLHGSSWSSWGVCSPTPVGMHLAVRHALCAVRCQSAYTPADQAGIPAAGAELAAPEPPEVVAPAPQTEDDIKAVVARAHKRRQESAAKLEAQSSVDAPGLARMGDPPPKVAKTPNGTAGGSSRAPPADEKRTSGIEVY